MCVSERERERERERVVGMAYNRDWGYDWGMSIGKQNQNKQSTTIISAWGAESAGRRSLK